MLRATYAEPSSAATVTETPHCGATVGCRVVHLDRVPHPIAADDETICACVNAYYCAANRAAHRVSCRGRRCGRRCGRGRILRRGRHIPLIDRSSTRSRWESDRDSAQYRPDPAHENCSQDGDTYPRAKHLAHPSHFTLLLLTRLSPRSGYYAPIARSDAFHVSFMLDFHT
jgi:hypothetical protein